MLELVACIHLFDVEKNCFIKDIVHLSSIQDQVSLVDLVVRNYTLSQHISATNNRATNISRFPLIITIINGIIRLRQGDIKRS